MLDVFGPDDGFGHVARLCKQHASASARVGLASSSFGQYAAAMDALTLLKEDHERIKKMLADGEKTTERGEKTRTELFERLKETMVAHEAMEEEVLYPALKAHPKAKDLTLEAYEEHHVVDLVFEELEKTPVADDQWGAKFTVAKENIEHHIEEEETEMFKMCRDIFSADELDQMGNKMAEIQMAAKQVLGGG